MITRIKAIVVSIVAGGVMMWGSVAAGNENAAYAVKQVGECIGMLAGRMGADLDRTEKSLKSMCQIAQSRLQELKIEPCSAAEFEQATQNAPVPYGYFYAKSGDDKSICDTLIINTEKWDQLTASNNTSELLKAMEGLAYAMGQTLCAKRISPYWGKVENGNCVPLYDAKKQANPAAVMGAYLAAYLHNRLTQDSMSWHDWVQKQAEQEPKWTEFAAECVAHYPAEEEAFLRMTTLETNWVCCLDVLDDEPRERAMAFLKRGMQEMPVWAAQHSIPTDQVDYVLKKYKVEGLEEEKPAEAALALADNGENGKNALTGKTREEQQALFVAVIAQHLEMREKDASYWKVESLKEGSAEWKKRERYLLDTFDSLMDVAADHILQLYKLAAKINSREMLENNQELVHFVIQQLDDDLALLIPMGKELESYLSPDTREATTARVRKRILTLSRAFMKTLELSDNRLQRILPRAQYKQITDQVARKYQNIMGYLILWTMAEAMGNTQE